MNTRARIHPIQNDKLSSKTFYFISKFLLQWTVKFSACNIETPKQPIRADSFAFTHTNTNLRHIYIHTCIMHRSLFTSCSVLCSCSFNHVACKSQLDCFDFCSFFYYGFSCYKSGNVVNRREKNHFSHTKSHFIVTMATVVAKLVLKTNANLLVYSNNKTWNFSELWAICKVVNMMWINVVFLSLLSVLSSILFEWKKRRRKTRWKNDRFNTYSNWFIWCQDSN